MKAALAGLVMLVAVAGVAGSSSAHPAGAAGGTSPGLYSFDASSQTLKQLVKGDHEREDVWWSPDGTWIASTDTSDFLVDVVRWGGGGLHDVVSVSWSPNGSKVAYTKAKGLYVGPSNWSRARLVIHDPGSDALDWAADGGRFVFGGGRSSSCCWKSLYVSRADGTGVRTLWTPPADGPDASWINDASWSPTGRKVALDATINNAVASRNGGDFLYLVNPARKGATRVSYAVNATFREWSPDGRWLILASQKSVYRLSPRGGKARSLCSQTCPRAVFSPDGRHFAFATSNGKGGSTSTLWVGNVDGSSTQRIAELTTPTNIVWSPSGRTLGLTLPAPDGDHSSIAVVDLTTKTIKPLTDGTQAEDVAGVSSDGSVAAFYRADPASLWVINTNGGEARMVMTLTADPDLGPCPYVAWSPNSPVLAIANEACEPS